MEQAFSTVRMENFPDTSSYCQHLKFLADQLSNVKAPVTNAMLVLQLVVRLTDAYNHEGTQIRHGDSLSNFFLEET